MLDFSANRKEMYYSMHKGQCLVCCVMASGMLLRNLKGVCSHGVSRAAVRYVTVTRVVWDNENDVDRRSLSC